MKKDELIGTWKLIEYASFYDTNEVIYPYGEDAVGYLIYTPDNYMSISIMRANRIKQETNNADNTIEAKVEMADNYGGYAGKYELIANDLFHFPVAAKFANFVQVPQKKSCYFLDDNLVIEYLHPIDEQNKQDKVAIRKAVKSRLSWKKVGK